MKFKKDKSMVFYEIENQVKLEVEKAFQTRPPQYYGEKVNINVTDIIQEAIVKGVSAGLETLLENEYTDEDFEKDINLR